MQVQYFSLPMDVGRVIRQEEHPRISLQQSVIRHLHLLLTTAFGEFSGDEDFGCGIWDHDFDNVTSVHKLKEIIRQSLLKAIQEKEKRLTGVKVDLLIVQEELPVSSGMHNIKKKISITITGILQLTNEKLHFQDSFYIGPLSY
ncbi:MAG: GPW/gp25 family protein [Agriterribacter sp.]